MATKVQEERNVIWIQDDAGNITNVVDADEVIALFREGVKVQLTYRHHPVVSQQVFPTEDTATDYANRVARMMGWPNFPRK